MIDEQTNNIGRPAYYMINCSHPDHFMHIYDDDNVQKRGIIATSNPIMRIK